MPEYQRWKGIMKAYPFEEKRLAKWNPPYIVQPKFDGDRCRNEPLTDTSLLLTSEENIFYSVPHIMKELQDSGLWTEPLDGELYSHELMMEGGHELIHSVASRSVNIHPRHEELEFWVFDLKIPDVGQITRMNELLKMAISFPPHIKVAPYWICYTLDDIKRVYDKLISLGYEGIIIRHMLNLYEEKRSISMMKFKPKRHDTYKIVGWNEEVSIHGVPKGRIGSLVLTSQDGDLFAVSAGLDDADRDRLWEERDSLAGKIARVGYQHLTNRHVPKGCFDIEVLDEIGGK